MKTTSAPLNDPGRPSIPKVRENTPGKESVVKPNMTEKQRSKLRQESIVDLSIRSSYFVAAEILAVAATLGCAASIASAQSAAPAPTNPAPTSPAPTSP